MWLYDENLRLLLIILVVMVLGSTCLALIVTITERDNRMLRRHVQELE